MLNEDMEFYNVLPELPGTISDPRMKVEGNTDKRASDAKVGQCGQPSSSEVGNQETIQKGAQDSTWTRLQDKRKNRRRYR